VHPIDDDDMREFVYSAQGIFQILVDYYLRGNCFPILSFRLGDVVFDETDWC